MAHGQEQHEIISLLKDLALELGRSPKADDLVGVKGLSKYRVTQAFGSFVIAMQAAGLEMARPSKLRKIGNEIFERELVPHLELQHVRQTTPQGSNLILPIEDYPTTVILGDIHAPFHHKGAVDFAISVIEKLKPKRVVQIGDMKDMLSWAAFPRSHNVFTPKEEFQQARKACEDIWLRVQRASPGVECYALLGNHSTRPIKRLLENCPELEIFIDMKPYFSYPGVELIPDDRQELNLDGVVFIHGYRGKLGDHRDFMNACVVTGHTHRGGAVFKNTWNGHQIWELNAGLLGDPLSKGLSYTPQKYTHWTLGVAVIDAYGPRFIPYKPKS